MFFSNLLGFSGKDQIKTLEPGSCKFRDTNKDRNAMYSRKEVMTGQSLTLAGPVLATSATSMPLKGSCWSELKLNGMVQWGKRRVRNKKNKQGLKSSTGSKDEAEKEEEEHCSKEKDVLVENIHYSKRKLSGKNTRTATLKRRKCQDPIFARELKALMEEMVEMRRDMQRVMSKEEQDSVHLKQLEALREEVGKLREDMQKIMSKEEQDSVYLKEFEVPRDLQKIASEKQVMNSTIIDLQRGQDGCFSLLPLKIEEPLMETSGYICPIDQATTDDLSLSLMSKAQSSAWLGGPLLGM